MPLFALVFALLVSCLGACGHVEDAHSPNAVASAAALGGRAGGIEGDDDEDGQVAIEKDQARKGPDNDGDGDSAGSGYYDEDDQFQLFYGHPASVAQTRAIVSAVTRYYADAAADRAGAACGLLSASVVRVVLAYGRPTGPPSLHGHGCDAVMAKLLRQLHSQMSGGGTGALEVGVVRVEGATAKVLLAFGEPWPLHYTELRRERGSWKIDALLDYGVP